MHRLTSKQRLPVDKRGIHLLDLLVLKYSGTKEIDDNDGSGNECDGDNHDKDDGDL